MSALIPFVYNDERIDATELAARIYPDRPRKASTKHVKRALTERADTPEGERTAQAMQQQVRQLAADLHEALAVPAATGLVPMALDTRLASQPLARLVFATFTPSTARTYWKAVRDGNKKLEYGQRIALRAALVKLATDCEEAAK